MLFDLMLVMSVADLEMVLRDGPAKPNLSCAFRCGWPNNCCATKPAEPTAKPAISGLQRVYSSTHLLGSYR